MGPLRFQQGNTNLEAYKQQLAAFMSIVSSQRHLPALKQVLRLYTVRLARVVLAQAWGRVALWQGSEFPSMFLALDSWSSPPRPAHAPPQRTSLTHARATAVQSISLSKLARLAELDEATLRSQLDLLRASTQVVTWNGGDALAGSPAPAGDLDFTLENGADGEVMVVVHESRAATAGGCAFLTGHIQKLQDIVAELDSIKLPQPAAAPQPAPTAAAR